MEDTTNPAAAAVNAVREPGAQGDASINGVAGTSVTPSAPNPSDEVWARKERVFRKQQADFASEKQKWHELKESERQRYETDYVPKNEIKENTLGVLMDMGITPDQLTQLVLSGHNTQDPVVKAIRAEIKALKDEMGKTKQSSEEMHKRQEAEAVKMLHSEVKAYINSSAEFETIKSQGMEAAVAELIQQTLDKEGYLMDTEEAASTIENHLIEETIKLASLPKIQQRLKPQTPTAPVKADPAPSMQSHQPKPTLQQRMQVSTARLDNSWEAKKARAIAKLSGGQ